MSTTPSETRSQTFTNMSTTPSESRSKNTPNTRKSLLSDSNALEKENNVLRQGLRCHFCGGNYEHIATGNGQTCIFATDHDHRLSVEQQGIIKKNNSRIKQTISQRERRFKMRTQNPEVYEKQKKQNSAHKAAIRESEDYRVAERLRAQELRSALTPLYIFRPKVFLNRIQILRHRPDVLISEDVLEQLDANEDFMNPKYKKSEGEMYNRICKHLSFEYLTNNCCAVCERCKPKSFTMFVPVTDTAFIMRLQECVGFTPERRRRMPEKVQANYSVDVYDQRLKNIILSKYGLYRGSNKTPIDTACFDTVEDIQVCICKDCKEDMRDKNIKSATSSNITVNNFIDPGLPAFYQSSGSDSDTETSRSQSNASPAQKRKNTDA